MISKPVLLSVKNLGVTVNGHRLVEGVTFDLNRGDILALIGPNGAGKTTVLKALLGLLSFSGTVKWQKKITAGYVPQRFSFDENFPLTVGELLILRVKKTSFWFHTKRTHSIIRDSLRIVGAEKLAHRRIGALSGGELQRVLLAYALVNDPTVLFLDEPVAGIDIEGEETFYNLIKRLNEDQNMTIILVSHDLNIVYKYAAEVVCLNKKMLCFGPPHQALTSEAIKATYGDEVAGFNHRH